MKIQIPYYNSFWLKNVKDTDYDYRVPQWPGFEWQNGSAPYASYPTYPFGNVVGGAAGAYNTALGSSSNPGSAGNTTPAERWWYIEESRIRGGYNNTSIELGVKAYIADNNKIGVYKGNSLIFSGIYNSSTEFNETNVFSTAEPITRSLNPAYGDIKKLYTAETNLVVFQEAKTSKILVNKNQAYNNLEGSTDNSRVLGQVSPYVGKYGISDYPESFGVYANRRYFVDKNKGVVLRLSNDGLTEISNYGMRDFFRDTFESISEEPEVYQVLDNSGSSQIGVEIDNQNSTSDIFTMKLLNINCCDITPGTLVLLDDPANPGNAINLENSVFSDLVYITSIDCSTNLITLSSTNIIGRIFPAPVQSFTTSISLLSTGLNYTTGVRQTETTGSGVGLTILINAADGSGGVVNLPGSGYQTGDVVTLLEAGSSNSAQYTVTITPIAGGWNYVYLQNFYSSKIYGGYDIHNDNYTLSIQSNPAIVADSSTYKSENSFLDLSKNTYKTLSFDESVKGWVSFYSFKPTWVGSIRNIFISTNKSSIYFHYDQTVDNNRGKFYNATVPAKANVTFLFNDFPNTSKNFNTISYEGASGWEVEYVKSDFEGVNYINSSWGENQDSINSVRSYLQGKYELNNLTNTGLNALNGPFGYAGFNRKENRYVSNIINNSVARPNEIIFGNKMSGIKGFFVETKLSIDTVTEPGGMKELFSVGTKFVQSS